MAAVFRNWARCGFTEGISGHISVRDPEHPHCIWMNPIGKHFALLDARDMLCLDVRSGEVVGGNRVGFCVLSLCWSLCRLVANDIWMDG